MAEVRAVPRNGLKVVSLFSGGGGSSLGYAMAGMHVVWASEFVKAARETYAANFPGTPVDDRDVRKVEPKEILAQTGMKIGELDVLDGSPPCAAFSTSGKRERDWGAVKAYSDTRQRTDDLFFEFVRILRGLKPRAFVAENVSGLVKGVAKGYFLEILKELKESGYRVAARVLDAKWLGVPQSRQRLFFVGFREDLDIEPAHPTPLPYFYTLRDVFESLRVVTKKGERSNEPAPTVMTHNRPRTFSQIMAVDDEPSEGPQITTRYRPGGAPARERMLSSDEPAPTVSAAGMGTGFASQVRVRHGNKAPFDMKGKEIPLDDPCPTVLGGDTIGCAPFQFQVEEEDASNIERFVIGPEWHRLAEGGKSEKYLNLVRGGTNESSPAITAKGGNAGAAGPTHPTEPRKFTIAELKRICSFPDDFVLTGTYQQMWERCGRAVPPLMMRAVAAVVRDGLLAAKKRR